MAGFFSGWLNIILDSLAVYSAFIASYIAIFLVILGISQLKKDMKIEFGYTVLMLCIAAFSSPYTLTLVGYWKLGFISSILYAAFSIFVSFLTIFLVGMLLQIIWLILQSIFNRS